MDAAIALAAMTITATCRSCRAVFPSRMLGFGPGNVIESITLSGNVESCPYCGGTADVISGRFSFVDGVLKAFTEPDVTRTKVEAFQTAAERVQRGEITVSEARSETAKQSASLAKIWDWIGDNDRQLIVLITIIGLLLAHYHFRKTSADAQADLEVRQSAAQAGLMNAQAGLTNAQADLTNAQALEMIGEELRKMNARAPEQESQGQAGQPSQTKTPERKTSEKNRHERRKEAAVERRDAKSRNEE